MSLRQEAFLQNSQGTIVDKFGVWLSGWQIRRHVPTFAGKRIGDFGCGYQAAFSRTILGDVASAVLCDVALADDLKRDPRVQAIEGTLPGGAGRAPRGVAGRRHDRLGARARPPAATPARRGAPAASARRRDAVNVPSWRGKKYLELSAFRLGLSPASEMDDHKMYYDVKDLWPLLVAAGFRPSRIDCFSHKLGLNTFAACRAEP